MTGAEHEYESLRKCVLTITRRINVNTTQPRRSEREDKYNTICTYEYVYHQKGVAINHF